MQIGLLSERSLTNFTSYALRRKTSRFGDAVASKRSFLTPVHENGGKSAKTAEQISLSIATQEERGEIRVVDRRRRDARDRRSRTSA
ncbi:unnamed protein product [Arabidopsis thaliana]|jgi:hypothetical protein|uniref:Uncharacterized protein n=1 Tax=Arabidopsis thaliana TaxID=3702 RepID=Q9LV61_ARATH|nr:unnamed protein product [Arabidopsis thaliana]